MAPTKRGAPTASSSKQVRSKSGKPTKAEKSAANKAAFRESKNFVQREVEAASGKPHIGRPPFPYTEELGQTLFELVATGHSLDKIVAMDGMPSLGPLLGWIADDTHPFSKLYARGKAMLVPLFEERAQLAATQPNKFIIVTRKQVLDRDGDIVDIVEEKEVDNTARSALIMDAYKWTLGHLLPKKHGRMPDLNSGKPNEQLEGLFAALKAGPKE